MLVRRNGFAHHRARACLRGLLLSVLISLVTLGTVAARGATLPLPPAGERVVGEVGHAVIEPEDTFLDLARRYDVGLNEMIAANPGVDPWLPKPGTRVVIPQRFILPDAPREGIVVNLPEMRLYYYPPPRPGRPAVVITHPLGIGAEGKSLPLGTTKIVEKIKDPTWVVPDSIIKEHAAEGRPVPKVVPPGPDDPLGAFAMRLGWTSYLIHGTNHPYGIGMRVSHGCLRMYPEDIESLFKQVPVGTPVRIVDQPFKAGWRDGKLYLEAHAPLVDDKQRPPFDLTGAVSSVLAQTSQRIDNRTWGRIMAIAAQQRGIPVAVGLQHAQAAKAPAGANQHSSEAEPSPAASENGWYIQMGAFRKQAATRRVTELVADLHVNVVTGAPKDSPLCRILVGPFTDRGHAAAREKALREATGIEGIVYPEYRYSGYTPCS